MKEIIINSNDNNKRLDSFIKKILYNIPDNLIYKYIRKKRIKVNNKKSVPDYRLQTNDIISLYINDEFFEKNNSNHNNFENSSTDLDIIYEDNNIILINKPVGVLVHPGDNLDANHENSNSIINRLKKYLYLKKEYIPENENSFAPALVNRIDRNTCGIIIAAKNSESLAILNQKIKQREISKYYLCHAYGIFDKKTDILKAYLEKNHSENRVYINTSKKSNLQDNSKTILTQYTVLKEFDNTSLLEIKLLTGRTHQIRAHLSYINHPILGDSKYGKNFINKKFKYKYQALCSYKLSFDFKTDYGSLSYLSGKEFALPEDKIWFWEQI